MGGWVMDLYAREFENRGISLIRIEVDVRIAEGGLMQ